MLQRSRKKQRVIFSIAAFAGLCFLALHTHDEYYSLNTIIDRDHRKLEWGMALPEMIDRNMADISDPFTPNDTPLFLHIPKSGGSSAKQYYAICMKLIVASQNGINDGHDQDEALQVIMYPPNTHQRYVNIDASTPEGLIRAKQLGFGMSNMAEVMFSPLFYKSVEVFEGPTYRARAFGLFRDPVEREISRFYYKRIAEHEGGSGVYAPELNFVTIAKYSLMGFWDGNAVVRMLADLGDKQPTTKHLELAMEIVRRKILVGLMDRMDESMAIFDQYFGFIPDPYFHDQDWYMGCKMNLFGGGANHNSNKRQVDPESSAYKNLARRNRYDRELYAYIVSLFESRKQLEGVDEARLGARVNGRVHNGPNQPPDQLPPPLPEGDPSNNDYGHTR